MPCLIIEDEYPAAERLKALLAKVAPEIEVLAVLDSVATATAWLRSHPSPELILSDIQLSDGLSFAIYEAVPLRCPVIFTTAYDEYAIRAFQVNSVDYLLKPIRPQALRKALDKWQALRSDFSAQTTQQQLQQVLAELQPAPSYKQRFLVQGRDQLLPVEVGEIAYFHSAHEVVYLVRRDGRRFATEYTLDQLSERLDPRQFFRLNRQYLGHLHCMASIHPYFNGRLKLHLQPDPGEEVIVSREKAKPFKAWLEGES